MAVNTIVVSVEKVKINRYGYDASGKYYGPGARVFRGSIVKKSTDIPDDNPLIEHYATDTDDRIIRAYDKNSAEKIFVDRLDAHFTVKVK